MLFCVCLGMLGAQASLVARASGTDPLAEQGLSFFTYLALIGHLGKTTHITNKQD